MPGRFVELKVPIAREVVMREGPGGGSTGGSLRGQGQDHSHSVIITWQCLPGTSPSPGAVQLQQRRGELVLELLAPGEKAASEPTSHGLQREACQLKKMHNVFYLEQLEDCSPGDSISDSSEELL